MSESDSLIPISASSRPRHIAIIMDGNNRWAKGRRLIGVAGHKAGVDAVRAVVETCAQEGIEALTLFAFSSENWRRPEEEVSALMKLFVMALEREVKKLHQNNIRLRIVGDRTAFNARLQKLMSDAEALTAKNSHMTLNIAANYGGQWDITEAVKVLARQVASGDLSPDQIDPTMIQSELCLADLPMPDLLIRTAGEYRISNFMLWQLAYTEYYFTDVYWPDFKHEEMTKAIEEYARRRRRFGQTDEQVKGQESC